MNSLMAEMPNTAKTTLRIRDMWCTSCSSKIENKLKSEAGIKSAEVAHTTGMGIFEYDTETWSVPRLIEYIVEMGHEASEVAPSREDYVELCISNEFGLYWTLELLCSIQDISSADFKFVIKDGKEIPDLVEKIQRVANVGEIEVYDERIALQTQALTRTEEVFEWRQRFLRSLAFAIPSFFVSMIGMHIPGIRSILTINLFNAIYLGDVLALFIATPAQFWIGAAFHRAAYRSLKHGTATMNVLVTLGTSAAYFYSLFVMFFALFNTTPGYRPFLFFETSTMLITFVSLGRYLENKAKGKTSAAITDLMALAPSMAVIYTDAPVCTQEKEIPTEFVQVGDVIKVVPGDKIPADGIVVRGSSSVDESAITGEAIPVLKQVGDSVIGGTSNNQGTFDMVATHAGKDTALSQIVDLVEEAQMSKAPIQAFADRLAAYFVPTIIFFAISTFAAWAIVTALFADEELPEMFRVHGANKLAVCLQMCISVVVVACPCALGLATPTAIMVGTGMGVKSGILVKGGRALEASRNVKKVVLDKTGTITLGRLSVVGVQWFARSATTSLVNEKLYEGGGWDTICADGVATRREVMAIVSAVEARSEHPLAKAVAEYGKELLGDLVSQVEVTDFQSTTGQGVRATVQCTGRTVTLLVGNARFVATARTGAQDHPPLPSSSSTYETQEAQLGRTVIYVSIMPFDAKGKSKEQLDPLPILALSLSDTPRVSSRSAVRALENMGVEVFMMTGDGQATACAIAKQVDIKLENVYAGINPQEKAAKVKELMRREEGGVAMVGDGINDSPALAAATVGIALSSGTSIAVEAADIVLMRPDLLDIVAALDLSRKTLGTIKRNLVWACLYNLFCIPLAMGLFLPLGLHMHPMTAGAAMAFSSLSVVLSSLALRGWKRPKESLMSAETSENDSRLQKHKCGWRQVLEAVGSFIRQVGTPGRSRLGYTQVPVELDSRDVV